MQSPLDLVNAILVKNIDEEVKISLLIIFLDLKRYRVSALLTGQTLI